MIGNCLRQLNAGSEQQKAEHNNVCGVERSYFANYFSLGSVRYDNKYHYSLRQCDKKKNSKHRLFQKVRKATGNKPFSLLIIHWEGGCRRQIKLVFHNISLLSYGYLKNLIYLSVFLHSNKCSRGY